MTGAFLALLKLALTLVITGLMASFESAANDAENRGTCLGQGGTFAGQGYI